VIRIAITIEAFEAIAATLLLAANQRLRRAIMDENGGGAGRFVGAFATGDRVRLT